MTTPLPLTEAPGLPGGYVLTLDANQGPMTVLDHALIQRLEATLKAVPAGATGLVVASASPRVFVAGADLKQVSSLSDADLMRYLEYGQRVYGMLCALPCWTAAAIGGAALGGGLELAMHCDALIGAPSGSGKPFPIGLPEAGLCICPGWGGTNLLPARMDPAEAIQRTATGATMTSDEARAKGLFDAWAETGEGLIGAAVEWIRSAQRGVSAPGGWGVGGGGYPKRDGMPRRWIGRPEVKSRVIAGLIQARGVLTPTDWGGAVLAAVEAGLERGWAAALDLEARELTRLRSAAAGKSAIEAFFAKGAAKKG